MDRTGNELSRELVEAAAARRGLDPKKRADRMELAKAIEVDERTIRRWSKAETAARGEELRRLAREAGREDLATEPPRQSWPKLDQILGELTDHRRIVEGNDREMSLPDLVRQLTESAREVAAASQQLVKVAARFPEEPPARGARRRS